MKRCGTCRQEKPLSEFGKDKYRSDGLRWQCHPCQAESCRSYYESHSAKRRRWARENAHRYSRTKRIRRHGTEKENARRTLREAVEHGDIVKPSACQGCGKVLPKRKLQGHHPDYSKPLEVRWLCAKCHCAEHRIYLAASRREKQ